MNDIRKGEDSNCKQIFNRPSPDERHQKGGGEGQLKICLQLLSSPFLMSFIRGRTIKDLFTVTVLPLSDMSFIRGRIIKEGKDSNCKQIFNCPTPDERHQKGGGQ
jgi:hypothetical protein